MKEFGFFNKIILVDGIDNYVVKWRNEIESIYPHDLLEYDIENLVYIEKNIPVYTNGVIEYKDVFHRFSTKLKSDYSKHKSDMLYEAENRLSSLALESKRISEYKKAIKIQYKVLKENCTNECLLTQLEEHFKILSKITGILKSTNESVQLTSGSGLDLSLDANRIEIIVKLYDLEIYQDSLIRKDKTSKETFIDAFNSKEVNGEVYFNFQTKQIAFIINELYFKLELGFNKDRFDQLIGDSNLFYTKQNRLLTKNNIQASRSKDCKHSEGIKSFFKSLS